MFSEEEREKIDQLRQRVEKELTSDEQRGEFFLIRWLRARNMDVDKAEEMLKKSLAWRKETGADVILDNEDFPDKYKKLFMFAVFGEDVEGCPILLLPAGRHNHRMILEAEGMQACMRWNIIWMEKIMNMIKDQREKTGNPVYTFHEILDMEYYSYKSVTCKPAIDYIMNTQKMFDENYPEVLKSVTVINAPKIFALLFAFVRPLVPKATLDKLTIFGRDEEAWKAFFVQKGFSMHKIPPRWGGTLKGSDEFCSEEDVWIDAPIPLKYFKEVLEEDEEGFFTAKVAARDKLEIKYSTIENQATKIYWNFETDKHDISFQLSFKDATTNEELIMIPLKRVDSNKKAQEGSKTVSTSGTFVLLFDNKYSYTKSKSIKYKVVVSQA